jgi:hypothetical protein
MDPEHIATIAGWPSPKSVLDIQVFLDFANFYRRIIEGSLLSELLFTSPNSFGRIKLFEWTSEAQSAFEHLKVLFTSAPILRHFDPEIPITLHTDSSSFALSGNHLTIP